MAYKKYELSGQSGTEIVRWFFLGQPLIIVTSIIAGVTEALSPIVILPWLVLAFVIRTNAYALRSISRSSKSRSNSRMTKIVWVSSFYSIYFFFYGITIGPVYYYYRDEVTSFAWFYLLSPDAIWEFVGLYIETGYEISSFSVNGLLLVLVLLAECSILILGYLIYARDKISESRVFCEGCKTWAVQMNSKVVSYEEVAIDALESVEAAINKTALTEIVSPCLGVITLGCPLCKKSLAVQLERVTVSQDDKGTPTFERVVVGVYVPEVGTIPPIGTNPEVYNKNSESFNKKSL
jgi:hypothetical protein